PAHHQRIPAHRGSQRPVARALHRPPPRVLPDRAPRQPRGAAGRTRLPGQLPAGQADRGGRGLDPGRRDDRGRLVIGRAVPPGTSTPRPVALLLPGQGAQHQGMGVGLYEREPAFTDAIDDFFVLLGREGAAIRADWLSSNPRVAVDEAIRAQPLLFGIGYAMGRMLQSWGVEPSVLLGHSAGEYVAAALAGVVSLEDAAALLLSRVELFQHA